MAFWGVVGSFFGKMFSRLYARSSALATLAAVIFGFFVFLLLLVKMSVPLWLLVTMTALLCVVVLSFLGLYAYFARYNPGALRSEAYQARRDALEYLAGDDEQGYRREIRLEGDKLEGLALPHDYVGTKYRVEAPTMTTTESATAAEEDDSSADNDAEDATKKKALR